MPSVDFDSSSSTSLAPAPGGMTFCQTAALAIVLLAAGAAFGYIWVMRKSSTDLAETARSGRPSVHHVHYSAEDAPDPTPPHAPLFILVGDSTTADQAADGGGWGTGFSSFLARGARAINKGVNGASTKGYIESGLWDTVVDITRTDATFTKVYVTIQFGHNDQNPACGVSLAEYKFNLVRMAKDILLAGGMPILVTPLARRDFDGNEVVDNLKLYREATLEVYDIVKAKVKPGDATDEKIVSEEADVDEKDGLVDDSAMSTDDRAAVKVRVINLNAASLAYVNALGPEEAQEYNLHGFDTTHLNSHGSVVFGRMVADLVLGHPPELVKSGNQDKWMPGGHNDDDGLSGYIRPEPFLTGLIWHGKPA